MKEHIDTPKWLFSANPLVNSNFYIFHTSYPRFRAKFTGNAFEFEEEFDEIDERKREGLLKRAMDVYKAFCVYLSKKRKNNDNSNSDFGLELPAIF